MSFVCLSLYFLTGASSNFLGRRVCRFRHTWNQLGHYSEYVFSVPGSLSPSVPPVKHVRPLDVSPKLATTVPFGVAPTARPSGFSLLPRNVQSTCVVTALLFVSVIAAFTSRPLEVQFGSFFFFTSSGSALNFLNRWNPVAMTVLMLWSAPVWAGSGDLSPPCGLCFPASLRACEFFIGF